MTRISVSALLCNHSSSHRGDRVSVEVDNEMRGGSNRINMALTVRLLQVGQTVFINQYGWEKCPHLLPTIRAIFNTTRTPKCSGFLLDCVASWQTPRMASQGEWVRARESVRRAGRGMHAKVIGLVPLVNRGTGTFLTNNKTEFWSTWNTYSGPQGGGRTALNSRPTLKDSKGICTVWNYFTLKQNIN